MFPREGLAEVRRGLKKTFDGATEIDLVDRSIVVLVVERGSTKGSATEVLSLHISGESVMRKSEFGTGGSRRLRRSERRIHVGNAARRTGTPRSCLRASDRSQSSDAISREAIWHGVLAGCDLRGSTKERFTNGFTRPRKRPGR